MRRKPPIQVGISGQTIPQEWERFFTLMAQDIADLQGGGSGNVGFTNFIVSPLEVPELPDGLTVTFPSGSAYVDGQLAIIPAFTVTFEANSTYDYWLNSDGTWTIEQQPISSYYLKPHYPDKLKIWQIETSASTILVIYLNANTYPTVPRPSDVGVTIDIFNEYFHIYDVTIPWSAGLTTSFGTLLETAAGDVYQVYIPGVTGGTAPDSTAVGEIVDGTTTLFYYSRKDYLGMFRYGINNGIEYYFTNLGLKQICHKSLLTGSQLSSPAGTEMSTLVKKWIMGTFKHLLAPWVSIGDYELGMFVITDGWIWVAQNDGTAAVTNAAFTAAAPHTAGQTVVDGTVTWKAVREQYSGQLWFWLNADRTFQVYGGPDSHDSYAATFASLIARYIQLTDDFSWFSDPSPHPGLTYKQVFDEMMYYNLNIQLSNFLSKTFQNDINPTNGTVFDIQYLEDNCETYEGFRSAGYIYGVLGDTARQTAAVGNKVYVSSGIFGMYDQDYGLFGYFRGDDVSTWANSKQIGWYPWLQCQLFPEMNNVEEISYDFRQLVRKNLTLQWPNWWQDRQINVFPEMMFAYLCAHQWQDPHKAYSFLEKYDRYINNLGTQTIVDMANYLVTKDVLVPQFTILNATDTRINILTRAGQIIAFT